MRLDFLLLADHATAAEGKLYINGGGVTRLNVPAVPFQMPGLAIVVRYVVEGEDDFGKHSIGVQLEAPSGVKLLPDGDVAEVEVQSSPEAAEGEQQALQMSLNFGGIPILEEGIHHVTTSLDGEVTGTMDLPVVLLSVPDQQAANRAERRRQQRAKAKAK